MSVITTKVLQKSGDFAVVTKAEIAQSVCGAKLTRDVVVILALLALILLALIGEHVG